MRKFYILGAGISGLACAMELLKHSQDVVIYEKLNIPGGLARTEKWNEWNIDLAPHIYHTYDHALVQKWKQIFGELFIEKQFWCKNYRDGKLYDYPISREGISHLPENIREKIHEELKNCELKPGFTAKTFREYVQALIGPTLQQMFFEQYPKKVWGIDTDEMDANWAPKRIHIRKEISPFYQGQWSAVGKYGSGTIPVKMSEIIEGKNGKIFYEHSLKEIKLQDERIASLRFENGKKVEIDPTDIVISTLSIKQMASLLNLDTSLRFRSMIVGFWELNKPWVFPDGIDFMYFDSSEYWFHRVSEQKKFSSAGLPEEKALLCFETNCFFSDEIYSIPDEQFIDSIKKQFIKIGYCKEEEFIKGKVIHVPEIHPLLTMGYRNELAHVQSRIKRVGNLFTVGGPAEFNYSDMQILFRKAEDIVDLFFNQNAKFHKNIKSTTRIEFKTEIELNKLKVGKDNSVYVIAEAGLNHNGDMDIARKLIASAKNSGCNAIKFQLFSAYSRASDFYKEAKYSEKTLGMEENVYEMFKRLEITESQYKELIDYAKEVGIDIFATPFDEAAVEILERANTPFYKIASMDLTNIPLLRVIAATGKPMILSTGMSSIGEVEESLDAISTIGNNQVILLHCTSNYPCDPEDINLKAMDVMNNAFHIPVGLSDHSIGTAVSLAAVARGANVIEKHFTLNRKMEGPDHILSLEPETMKGMVEDIRIIEMALKGSGIKSPMSSEFENRNAYRKSLFARSIIEPGDRLTVSNTIIKGPGYGVPPKYVDILLGKKVSRQIQAGYPITWDDILG